MTKKNEAPNQRRQGDIFFEAVSAPPEESARKPFNSPAVALGEVTGHTHRILTPAMSELESYIDGDGDIFVLSKDKPIEIGHEEHGTIALEANEWWRITRQRQLNPVTAIPEQVQD